MKHIITFICITVFTKSYSQYSLLSEHIRICLEDSLQHGIIEVIPNSYYSDTVYIYGNTHQPDPHYIDSLLTQIRRNPILDSFNLLSRSYCNYWQIYFNNWLQDDAYNHNSKLKDVYSNTLNNFKYTADWVQIMSKPWNTKELYNLLKCSYFWDGYNIDRTSSKQQRIDTFIIDTLLKISEEHFENVSCCVDKRFYIKKMQCTLGPDSSSFYKGFSANAILELVDCLQNFIYAEIANNNYGTYTIESNLNLYVYHVELIRFLAETKCEFEIEKFNKLFLDYPNKILNGGYYSSLYLDKYANDNLLKRYALALEKKFTDREFWITIPSSILKRNKVCYYIISNSKNPEAKKRFAQAIDNDNGLFNKEIKKLEQAEKNKEIKLILKNKLKS